jgi:hypothetical protein
MGIFPFPSSRQPSSSESIEQQVFEIVARGCSMTNHQQNVNGG